MPILKGAVTCARYRVEPGERADLRRSLLKALRSHAFAPLDPRSEEDRSVGFVELENQEGVEFEVGSVFYGEHALFSFRVDTLKVSAAQVRAELERWAKGLEAEERRKPTRSEKAARRSAIVQRLRASTEPRTKLFDVAWNTGTSLLTVWAASRKSVDEVVEALEARLKLELSPCSAAALAHRMELDEARLEPSNALLGI